MTDGQNQTNDDLEVDWESGNSGETSANRSGKRDDLDLFSVPAESEPAPDLPKEEAAGSEDLKSAARDDSISFSKAKVLLIKKLVSNIRDNTEELFRLVSPILPGEDEGRIAIAQIGEEMLPIARTAGAEETGEKIIEGVFDGEKMVGPDGKVYNVPANYASKSKLLEGDMMKLTINRSGNFLYKQIGPVERQRIVGRLEKEPDGICYAAKDENRWRILNASVTYFRGETGDEVIILIPKHGQSGWAAVENIIKRN